MNRQYLLLCLRNSLHLKAPRASRWDPRGGRVSGLWHTFNIFHKICEGGCVGVPRLKNTSSYRMSPIRVRLWQKAKITIVLNDVRFRGYCGQAVLVVPKCLTPRMQLTLNLFGHRFRNAGSR